ncbi:MAG: TetR/AcrR family transcriptional regulator [Micropepsaceae bacterium]
MEPRDGILRAAQVVFSRHGFRQTAMSMVAEEARLTRQALYHHFDSKEALFAALVDLLHAQALAAAKDAAAKGGRDAAGAVTQIVMAYHGSIVANVAGSPFTTELVEESSRHCGPAISAHAKRYEKTLETAIAGLARAGRLTLRGTTAHELAQMVAVAAKGVKVAYAGESEAAHGQALKRMIELICAGAGALPAKASSRTGTARRAIR